MKKFRASWLMSILVVGLAGYTFYEYRNASRDLDRALGERFAFSLKRENVDEIRLTSKDESVLMRKQGEEDWRVVEPVQDAAETSVVEGFLFQTMALKLKEFHSSEDGKLEYSKFGLEPPAATIEISSKGVKERISVSTKTAFDGSYYVRVGDEILIADPGIREVSERPGSNFRSRRLWRLPEDTAIERVRVERDGKEKFAFVKDKDKWVMESSREFPVDSGKVADWIEKVQTMLPSDFVKEGIEDADRTQFLLKKPGMVVTVDYKGKDAKSESWILTLGQERAEEIFMFTNQRPTLYKSARTSLDKVNVPKAYFRDGHAPFHFDVEKAREARVKTVKGEYSFKKDDKGWHLAGAKDLELNPEKLVQLFQNIRSLEAQEFVTGAVGIKGPPQIEIRGEGGEILLALAWGDEYKAQSPWSRKAPFRYVKSNLSKDAMGMAKDKLEKLVDESLVRKTGQSSSQPEKK